MHENMKTSMWHTGRSERTWRLPACGNQSVSCYVTSIWHAVNVACQNRNSM